MENSTCLGKPQLNVPNISSQEFEQDGIHAVLSYKEHCQILTSLFLIFPTFLYSFCS